MAQQDDLIDKELIAYKVLPEHPDLTDVFSYQSSNELPPHRTIDHKIVLEQENLLGFSPLYQILTAEL